MKKTALNGDVAEYDQYCWNEMHSHAILVDARCWANWKYFELIRLNGGGAPKQLNLSAMPFCGRQYLFGIKSLTSVIVEGMHCTVARMDASIWFFSSSASSDKQKLFQTIDLIWFEMYIHFDATHVQHASLQMQLVTIVHLVQNANVVCTMYEKTNWNSDRE